MKYGTLYGVGTGPGDPELLTLKAVRVLGEVDHIFAARSAKNHHSSALTAAGPHIRPGVGVTLLPFPMTRDRDELRAAWAENAATILAALEQGKSAAFLTLGDPLTYSTFGYLMRTIADLAPQVRVRAVPGVTAIQASAAAATFVLAEEEERLAVVSGAKGGEHIREAAKAADTLVVLKAYKRWAEVRAALAEAGMDRQAVVVENCSMNGQRITPGLLPEDAKPGYFTLVLARRKPPNGVR